MERLWPPELRRERRGQSVEPQHTLKISNVFSFIPAGRSFSQSQRLFHQRQQPLTFDHGRRRRGSRTSQAAEQLLCSFHSNILILDRGLTFLRLKLGLKPSYSVFLPPKGARSSLRPEGLTRTAQQRARSDRPANEGSPKLRTPTANRDVCVVSRASGAAAVKRSDRKRWDQSGTPSIKRIKRIKATYLRSSRARHTNGGVCPHAPDRSLRVPYSKRLVLSLKFHPLSLETNKNNKQKQQRLFGEKRSSLSRRSAQLSSGFRLLSTKTAVTGQRKASRRFRGCTAALLRPPGWVRVPLTDGSAPQSELSSGTPSPPGWWAGQQLHTKASDATPRSPHLVSRP